jgi:small redox-active disulfide protein 2
MKLEILGTGCPRCEKLTELARESVKELGITAEIVKVDKIQDIMNYGVMVTPALAIDGVVKVAGRIPSKEEIKNWIKEKQGK